MYRILTQRKPNIRRILNKYFDAYTLYPATGRWNGKSESSIVAEIDTRDFHRIRRAARDIKRENKQDAVLVQQIQTTGELI